MLFAEVIRVALEAINANKMRSLLTMLGIVIGVAAVITMVALGTGAQRAVQEQIDALGTDVLTVRAGQGWYRGARSGNAKLTVDEALAVQNESGGDSRRGTGDVVQQAGRVRPVQRQHPHYRHDPGVRDGEQLLDVSGSVLRHT